MKKAPFITIEGGDGAGKTSLSSYLVKKLEGIGWNVHATREPGGTNLGEKIRSLVLNAQYPVGNQAELALFLAARAQHIEEVLLPKLSSGVLVLCDRFHDSTVAYQGGARDMGEDFVERLCALITGNFSPDLTLYLDISPKEALARGERTNDRIESNDLRFHEKIRSTYHSLVKKHPQRMRLIDASLAINQVQENAWKTLYPFLQGSTDA
ncbi:MAG: dTMP kinase [Chlamydiota bacterium]